MKKATFAKNKKRAESGQKQSSRVDAETVKILRTVRNQEAFYFYEDVGKPTGEVARNLPDFLAMVKSVRSESLMFHLQRGDFQNWVGKVLGDSKLAEKLQTISPSNRDDTRMSIYKAIENRIRELRESSVAVLVEKDSTILLPP